ncbi:S-adenosyl-L-methionine-dependent methyltransferase [Schizophyllum commune H4-8]|uniref:S-adenosyl-L-methionine-dependent methyltransferase n=1 Tax=Schizophyllum commune (strain H4-8 / FGSC 9210) TaxID=578458 RepID=UPI00215E1108|nr:S-adenosyl-L-methionine-dependent methyltransferase [Schizophyllum commune H4-8]KAI5888465.1 S-adenosyl-L-methionine-dependent methyltransferase [Schizophyllum commune H4-8]
MSTQPSPLRALADSISQAVTVIEDAYTVANLSYPSLTGSFDPASPAETLLMRPDVAQAAALVSLGCRALDAAAGSPGIKTMPAFEVAVNGYVAEILRSKPAGMHVNEIATVNGFDAAILGRVLRKLASAFVFVEVAPNVFANNRLSCTLDTGKTVEEIKANPVARFTGALGVASLISHATDTNFKGAARLYEWLQDKNHGDGPEHAPVPRAFGTSLPLYAWLEQPGNEHRLASFAAAMNAREDIQPPEAILQVLDFSTLPAGTKVVDVGAGIGHFSLTIAKKYPDLHYVIQDRAAVVEKAKAHWSEHLPSATVEMIPHDFFQPQPVKEPGVFILNNILHNNGKSRCIRILKLLRDAAGFQTKLLIGEQIAPYACPEPVSLQGASDIKGADKLQAPVSPLLAPGLADWPASADLIMLLNFNSEERTLGGFIDLASETGWKIVEAKTIPGGVDGFMVAVPV